MANWEHLAMISQGTEIWNDWRKKVPHLSPDLSGAYLRGLNLALFKFGDLTSIDLRQVNFKDADLRGMDLRQANLEEANFSRASLRETCLSLSNLHKANFQSAYLKDTNFHSADLREADFQQAVLESTIFANVDLSSVKGLETVIPKGPFTIGIDTITRSRGQIPEIFLKNAGVSNLFIEYIQKIVKIPIEYYTCFISYSGKDQNFADRLYKDLQAEGVRCWFAPHDLRPGDVTWERIDESIRLYDKLLLVFSENSLSSAWVEQEVQMALAKERVEKRPMLFPIRIDNAIMDIPNGWPAHFRETRHIGNFEYWGKHNEYQKAFTRLLSDLKASSSQKK